MMDDTLAPPRQEDPNTSSIALFLGLFLLVLAFFILLVSMSTMEKVKSDAVRDSLTSTFSTILPPSTDPTTVAALQGEVLAGPRFQERIKALFDTAVQATKVEIVQPGRLMVVEISADTLFLPDEAVVQPTQQPLLDRIVASVSAAPSGLRFDMEFVIGSPFVGERSLPVDETLEIARAGAFAREMATRGVPPENVVVGIRHGDPKDVTIYFYVRSEEETRLRFVEDDPGSPTQEPPRTGARSAGPVPAGAPVSAAGR